MKWLWKNLAVLLLAVSWCGFWWLTGERTPWRMSGTQTGQALIATLELGDVPVAHYGRMGFTRAALEYLGGETAGWALGTDRGEIWLLDIDGKVIWKRSLGIGQVSFLKSNADGTVIFAGEQSPSGNIYAFDRKTGRELWKVSTAAGVGSAPHIRSYPATNYIETDAAGNLYVSAYRTGHDGRNLVYLGRIFSLTPSGELRWQFPDEAPMDTWGGWIAVAPDGRELAFSSSSYTLKANIQYSRSVYFLDAADGRQKERSIDLERVIPYSWVTIRGGPNYAADGQSFSMLTNDGRGFLFTKEAEPLWERRVLEARQVNDSWINAGGRFSYIIGDQVIFVTSGTYNGENWQMPTPLEHPAAGQIIAFDRSGTFRYRWQIGGNIEDIDFAGNLIACAIGRNIQSRQYSVHGVGVLDVRSGILKQRFTTDGPVQAIAISADAGRVAAVEAPAALPNGKIIGSYRLHIWQLPDKAAGNG